MDLTQFLQQLDELTASAVSTFEAAPDQETLEQARIDFLGAKKGQLKAAQKLFGAVGKEDRPTAGQRFNETKQAIEAALEQAQQRLQTSTDSGSQEDQQFDPTLPGQTLQLGHLHPITQTIEELKDIMGRLGFSVADGPEIEDVWE